MQRVIVVLLATCSGQVSYWPGLVWWPRSEDEKSWRDIKQLFGPENTLVALNIRKSFFYLKGFPCVTCSPPEWWCWCHGGTDVGGVDHKSTNHSSLKKILWSFCNLPSLLKNERMELNANPVTTSKFYFCRIGFAGKFNWTCSKLL